MDNRAIMGSFMNKFKTRFSIIITLFLAFVVTLGLALGATFPLKLSASAATSYEPSRIFSAGAGTTVTAYKTGTAEEDKAYVGFSMRQNDSKVYYRRSLAYKWFEKAENTESALENPGQAVYFSMKFSFPSFSPDFKSFTLTFECDEENVTKDGKSVNKLSFEMTDQGIGARLTRSGGNSSILRTKSNDIDDWTKGDFTLSFYEPEGVTAGEFALRLTYSDGVNTLNYYLENEDEQKIFAFTNIGDNYAEYRSSAASKPNTPITFTAEFEEPAEGEEEQDLEQKILMKELNGQSFEVKGYTVVDGAQLTEGTVAITGGTVDDTKAPSLVLSETVYSFTLGQKYSLTHHAIDVLDDSVTVTRRYYIAKKDDEDKYVAPDESKTDDYTTLTTSVAFMPIDDTQETVYLSIRFELEDGRTKADGERDYFYLTWYADNTAVATLDGWDYVKAEAKKDTDELKYNPEYKILYPDSQTKTNMHVAGSSGGEGEDLYTQTVEAYQKAVTEAASNTSAGEGSYIYLPSLRDLLGSKSADYRNLKFSVYYYTKQQAESATPLSETSLAYNALKIPVNIEGNYSFRVLATDAAGNAIKLYKDGELVDVTGSNIWEIDDIPTFNFSVEYKGVTIEESGEQTLGYRESTYTVKKFDIVALAGYKTDYRLYYFDEELLKDKTMPSYSTLVSEIGKYMSGDEEYKAYRDSIVEIQEYNDQYTKDDPEWDATHNDYNWNPTSSLSFNPQRSGYYIVQVTVTDAHLAGESVDGYQVIEIRNPIDVTPGRSNWLENNKVSVILFSIAGLLAIAIVVILVVNPSEKTPETVDLEKLKGKKKEKPSKK